MSTFRANREHLRSDDARLTGELLPDHWPTATPFTGGRRRRASLPVSSPLWTTAGALDIGGDGGIRQVPAGYLLTSAVIETEAANVGGPDCLPRGTSRG